MEKTLDLLIDETRAEIVEVLNKRGLPISVLNLILKDVCNVVEAQTKMSLEQQKIQYQQSLRKEEGQNGNNQEHKS